MLGDDRFRRLRGAVGNALVWGAGFAALGFGLFAALRVAGAVTGSWLYGISLAVRFGFFGVVAGGVFATLVRLLYRGRRLRDIGLVRFGVAGGVMTGVFVPLFLQAMNVVSGDGMVPWRLVLDDGVWALVFGGVAAGGSLWLAQRAEAAGASRGRDRLEQEPGPGRLAAGNVLDEHIAPRAAATRTRTR